MCDTFVHIDSSGKTNRITFGKNSDREPNEAQILEYHPPKAGIKDKSVKCTYIEIPQSNETRAVLISRPFWMWGAEIGVNDAGVSIGNEAVFTKMPMEKEKKLLGMDILRLALERSSTAESALETIIALLSDHGQGGPCGFEDKNLVYHNSYIISDPNEAWVLETAGPFWAAKKVEKLYAISNGLTIEKEFDRSHPGLIENARKKGWLKKGADFSFREAYSDWFFTTFSKCSVRRLQTEQQLKKHQETFTEMSAFKALRNHNGKENYSPGGHPFMSAVCAHAGVPVSRHASQSTASMVTVSTDTVLTAWATGTSAPCLSMFKPFRFSNPATLPDHNVGAGGIFHPESIWWRHEILHRSALKNYRKIGPEIQKSFEKDEAETIESLNKNRKEDVSASIRNTYDKERQLQEALVEALRSSPERKKQNIIYRNYWAAQNNKAGLSPVQ